jgi:VIT1/CCC1 family predicted Fe2+/Mn2+ transporter
VGGFIPLSPYILLSNLQTAQIASVIATLCALLIFGYFKARLTGISPVKGALQTALVGGLAAATAFLIAKAIG